MSNKFFKYKLEVNYASTEILKSISFNYEDVKLIFEEYRIIEKKPLNIFLLSVSKDYLELLLVLDRNRTLFLNIVDIKDFERFLRNSYSSYFSKNIAVYFEITSAVEVDIDDLILNDNDLATKLYNANIFGNKDVLNINEVDKILLNNQQSTNILNYLYSMIELSNESKVSQILSDLIEINKILCKYIDK